MSLKLTQRQRKKLKEVGDKLKGLSYKTEVSGNPEILKLIESMREISASLSEGLTPITTSEEIKIRAIEIMKKSGGEGAENPPILKPLKKFIEWLMELIAGFGETVIEKWLEAIGGGSPEIYPLTEDAEERFTEIYWERVMKVLETIIDDLEGVTETVDGLYLTLREPKALQIMYKWTIAGLFFSFLFDLAQTKVAGSGIDFRATSFMMRDLIPSPFFASAIYSALFGESVLIPLRQEIRKKFPAHLATEYQITKFFYEGHIDFSRAIDLFRRHGRTEVFAKKWLKIVEREPTRGETERFVRWALSPVDETPQSPLDYVPPAKAEELIREAEPEYDEVFGKGALRKAFNLAIQMMSKMRISPARCKLFVSSMWRMPSPFMWRWICEQVEINPLELQKWFIRHGYHPKVAKRLAGVMAKMTVRDERKMFATELMRYREKGLLPKDEFQAMLRGLEMTNTEIGLRSSVADMKLQREIIEWRRRTYVEQYRNAVIDDKALFDKLVEMGIDRVIANWIVNYERARLGLPEKEFAS